MQTARRLFVLKHSSKLKSKYVISHKLNCLSNFNNIDINKHLLNTVKNLLQKYHLS